MTEPVFAARRTKWHPGASQPESPLNEVIAKHAYASGGFNCTLLRQDTRDVLPRGWGARGGFEAIVKAEDPARATAVVSDALWQESGNPTLETALTKFFASIADVLLRYPVAYREIVFGHTPENADEPALTSFRLLPVPGGTVGTRFARRRNLVQYIPAATAGRHRRRPVGFINLDPDTLATFRLPTALERRVKKAFAAIAAAEPTFSSAAAAPPPGPGARHAGKAMPCLTDATAVFGWNGHTAPLTSEQLQPFHVWRRLEHLAFKIEMRDAILACLNQALRQAGQRIGMSISVQLQHVTTLQEARRAQDDLRHGRQSLETLTSWSLQ